MPRMYGKRRVRSYSKRRVSKRSSDITAAIWLIGLGILFWTGYWWPGILILVGISMLVTALMPKDEVVDDVDFEDEPVKKDLENDEDGWDEDQDEEPVFVKSSSRLTPDRLPEACQNCGGPIRENYHKVKWLDDQNIECPFCETIIPL